MSSNKKVSSSQMPLWESASVAQPLSPSRKALVSQILRKQEELRIGMLDYERHKPDEKQIIQAAQTKHYNRAKINGEWYDVKFCKYLLRFLNTWKGRALGLEMEIRELKRQLEQM